MCEALHVTVFHGEQKPQGYKPLIDTDLVLTTYSTLASDYKKSGLLHKMEWYRVVLDEGKIKSFLPLGTEIVAKVTQHRRI